MRQKWNKQNRWLETKSNSRQTSTFQEYLANYSVISPHASEKFNGVNEKTLWTKADNQDTHMKENMKWVLVNYILPLKHAGEFSRIQYVSQHFE